MKCNVSPRDPLCEIGASKRISLCGISPSQTTADLSGEREGASLVKLRPHDAILLASDLHLMTKLASLELKGNALGAEGATALAKGLSGARSPTLGSLRMPLAARVPRLSPPPSRAPRASPPSTSPPTI